LAGGKLVMEEVHRPDVVRPRRWMAVRAQLCLDTSFGRLVPELSTQFLVERAGSLEVHEPTLAPEWDMHTPIAVADARGADILIASIQAGLRA